MGGACCFMHADDIVESVGKRKYCCIKFFSAYNICIAQGWVQNAQGGANAPAPPKKIPEMYVLLYVTMNLLFNNIFGFQLYVVAHHL